MTPIEKSFQKHYGDAFNGDKELEEQVRKNFFTGALALLALIESSGQMTPYERSILMEDINTELTDFFNQEQGELVNG